MICRHDFALAATVDAHDRTALVLGSPVEVIQIDVMFLPFCRDCEATP